MTDAELENMQEQIKALNASVALLATLAQGSNPAGFDKYFANLKELLQKSPDDHIQRICDLVGVHAN